MGLKLRASTTNDKTISLDDIHVRAGGTSGDECSMGDADISSMNATTSTGTKTFQAQQNKWRIDTGSYQTTDGYFESFMGGSLGSVTENIFASTNDGGLFWNLTSTEARLDHIAAFTSGSNNPTFSVKWVVNSSGALLGISQGWSQITIRNPASTSANYERKKNTYASFNSGTGTWTWSNSVTNQTVVFPQSPGTRYLQLD